MLKTIKTTKQMNLQELIKHVWENGITDVTYTTQDGGARITFDADGDVETEFCIEKCDYFDVEVEEPITEDKMFETLVEIQKNEQVNLWFDTNITTYRNADTSKFYALINGSLILVWERDGE